MDTSHLSKIKILALAGLGGFIAVQFIPVDRSHPPVTGDVDAPPEVAAVLKRACFDCHSNETTWPWYSYLAPASWIIAHDVAEGREHLNFSHWTDVADKEQQHLKEEIAEETAHGAMPPRYYTLLHPDARVADAEVSALEHWATQP